MGFFRQEYWSGLLFFSSRGIFLTQGLNPCLLGLLHCRQIRYSLIHLQYIIWPLCASVFCKMKTIRVPISQGDHEYWKWMLLSCVWLFVTLNSPGWNSGVDSLSLFQGIFLTQGLNSGLLHCRQRFCHLSYREGLPWWLGCGIIPPPPPKVHYPLFSWVHFLFEHLHKSPNTLLHLDWLSPFPSNKILMSNLKDVPIKPSMPDPSQQKPLFPLTSINGCLHFILKIVVVKNKNK